MKAHELVRAVADGPVWICRVRSNYKRLRCRMPRLFRRLRAASPSSRRKTGA